jgi:hypothetical protein
LSTARGRSRAYIGYTTGGLSELGGFMGSKSKAPAPIDIGALRRQVTSLSNEFGRQRREDLARGKEAAAERFAEVGPQDLQSVIDTRREQTQGLTAQERSDLSQSGLENVQRAEQTALRQLRGAQGQAGVRGAQAGAQQADILKAGLSARGDVERGIMLQDIAQRRQALDQLESTFGRERAGFMAREMGEAALGAADRGAAIGLLSGARQAQTRGGKK